MLSLMKPIQEIERLQLLCQRMRNRGNAYSIEELQLDVERAIASIVHILKEQERRIDEVENLASKRRYF